MDQSKEFRLRISYRQRTKLHDALIHANTRHRHNLLNSIELGSYRRHDILADMQRINQRLFAAIVACAVILPLIAPNNVATARDDDREESGPSKEVYAKSQNRHSRVPNTKRLSPEQTEAIYQSNWGPLAKSYSRSGDEIAREYTNWRRANSASYPSFSHGRRFLNNYLNQKAKAYLNYKSAGILPTGAVIAKDSFAVGENGEFIAGPLFIMEKMPPGFNYVSGNWRYSTIAPDGALVGRTNGKNSDGMKFCISCHLAAEKNDHLFFFPKAYR